MRRPGAGKRAAVLVRAGTLALGTGGCGEERRAPLDSLVLRDSLYVEGGSGEPYTGRVFRSFEDGTPQLEGRLEGGRVENREEGEEASVYEELKREIESMGLYPPCPER